MGPLETDAADEMYEATLAFGMTTTSWLLLSVVP